MENARESVDAQGRIQGIRSTATLSNRASGLVGSLAFGDPIAAIFTTAASASVLRFSEPEISLPAGTELIAELTAPIVLPKMEPILVPPIATTPADKAGFTQAGGGAAVSDLYRQKPYPIGYHQPHLHRQRRRSSARIRRQ